MGEDDGEDADRPRGPDDRPRAAESEPEPEPAPDRGPGSGTERGAEGEPPTRARPQPPVDRALARLGGSLGGRSLSVYGVLLAGAAVLLILLAIIWITAGGGGDDDSPTCLNVTLDEVLARIEAAEVERARVTYPADNRLLGPVALRLDLTDGTCHNLQPQGVEAILPIKTVIGAITYYNEVSEERQIRLSYDASDSIDPAFLWTPSPVPSETPVPTPTEPTTPTVVPVVPTATPAPTPTATEPASPEASPEASPVDGSPVAPEPTAAETATVAAGG